MTLREAGVDEQTIWNLVQTRMLAAGCERDDASTLLLGQRTARPHSTGDAIGYHWTSRGNISLHPDGTDVIESGMTPHLPVILFQQGQFSVGVSETVLVTDDGAKTLSSLPRDLVRV